MKTPSPASLLALASALDAQGDSLKAQAASIRAAVQSSAQAPAPDAITVEEHQRRTGQNRRGTREFFGWCEREGFEVHRLGHAVFMQPDEWDRAIEARSPKRSPRAAHTNSTSESDAESVDALLAQKRGYTLAPPTQRGPRKRAA
jgi:hypothetical protein